jgi:hypothetical protein
MQGQRSAVDVGRADDEVEREVLALLLESGLPGRGRCGGSGCSSAARSRRLTR